jgi:hypothetical protein
MSRNKIGNSLFNLWKGTLLMLFLNSIFAFNVFSLSIVGNQTTKIFNDSHIHYTSMNSLSPGVFVQNPVSHKMNLVLESIIETEENLEEELDVFGFYNPFIDHMHDPAVSLLDETLSILPSLFFQKRNPVSLFILFHSWKNDFHKFFSPALRLYIHFNVI